MAEKKYSITKHNPAKREKNTVLLEHNPWPAKREKN